MLSASVVASVARNSNDNNDTYYEVHDGVTELEVTGTVRVCHPADGMPHVGRHASRSVWNSSRVAKAGLLRFC